MILGARLSSVSEKGNEHNFETGNRFAIVLLRNYIPFFFSSLYHHAREQQHFLTTAFVQQLGMHTYI